MYLLIIKEGKHFFFLIGPTRGFAKEAEGKREMMEAVKNYKKRELKLSSSSSSSIIITWLLLWLSWKSECVQIATFQQTPASCPPQWNLGRNRRKGNEEHRLDIRMAWLSDNQQKSVAFSSWALSAWRHREALLIGISDLTYFGYFLDSIWSGLSSTLWLINERK